MASEEHCDPNWKSAPAVRKDSENYNGCFDCNICLDFASDPVVTLCGHLYCWSCIYKWFHAQSASLPSDKHPQCPVCKDEILYRKVIPLYGRGQSKTDLNHEPRAASEGMLIPPRPAACGTQALLNAASQPRHQLPPYRNLYHQPYVHPYSGSEEAGSLSLSNQTSNVVANALQPVVRVLQGPVNARVFGRRLYTYPNSYHVVGGNSSRLRRQEMQVDKSLSRIYLFLLCCFLLCLLLF